MVHNEPPLVDFQKTGPKSLTCFQLQAQKLSGEGVRLLPPFKQNDWGQKIHAKTPSQASKIQIPGQSY